MTSASSKTKTLIFFKSKKLNLSWSSNYDVIGDFGISGNFFTSYSISENIGKKVKKICIYVSSALPKERPLGQAIEEIFSFHRGHEDIKKNFVEIFNRQR